MKTIIFLIFAGVATLSQAGHYDNKEVLNCRVTKMVDSTYFEESLSAFEYPDIDVAISAEGEYSLSVGSNSPYERSEKDTVSFNHVKHKGTLVTATNEYGDVVTLEVEYRRTLARATLRVKESGQAKTKTLAYGICDKGIF